jgi:preprotein translocase subunit SecE
MNRALRRQQLKDPKGGKGARGAAPRAMPRSAPRQAAREQPRRGGLFSWRPQFLGDVIGELRKVVWPTRDDVVHLTIVVVIIMILIGAVLGAIDIGFGWLIERTLLG